MSALDVSAAEFVEEIPNLTVEHTLEKPSAELGAIAHRFCEIRQDQWREHEEFLRASGFSGPYMTPPGPSEAEISESLRLFLDDHSNKSPEQLKDIADRLSPGGAHTGGLLVRLVTMRQSVKPSKKPWRALRESNPSFQIENQEESKALQGLSTVKPPGGPPNDSNGLEDRLSNRPPGPKRSSPADDGHRGRAHIISVLGKTKHTATEAGRQADPRPFVDRFGHRYSEAVIEGWSPAALKALQIRRLDEGGVR